MTLFPYPQHLTARLALWAALLAGLLLILLSGSPAQAGGPDLPFQAISAGGRHTCGLRPDGSLVCWGRNDYGQTDVPAPPGGLRYTQVSAGYDYTCGLVSDGALLCWGDNDDGQTTVPPLTGGQSYTQVSAGYRHTCGLRSNGSVVCWGYNNAGQMTVPPLTGGQSYTQVSAGGVHTCGLVSDGSLLCWGANSYGQTTVPSLPAGLSYTQVSAGELHTCGLVSDGSLLCWGYNGNGRTDVPILPGGQSYTQVSAGWFHTCGLVSDGSLLCWGYNIDGQTTVPPLPGGQSYSQVSAGELHTCGLVSDGTLRCWGLNDYGQINVPVYTQVSAGGYHTCGLVSDGSLLCWGASGDGRADVPPLPAGLSYTQVSAGGVHTCGRVSNGSLLCWGDNFLGQTSVPPLPAGLSYTQVSAGEYHTCGLRSDGSIVCWGDGGFGRTDVPPLPAGLSYTQVSAGGFHTCGRVSNGSLLCWGYNSSGQTDIPPLFGQDTLFPSVVSSAWAAANPTAAASVDFTVTFSEFVVGVDATDFTLTTSGLTGAAVTGVSGSGSVYTVTVSTGSGDGTLRLDVVADDSIRDAVNLPLGSAFTGGETYTIDKTAPTAVSSLRADASPTTADSVDFTVTFSEDVTGVDVGDFDLVTSGVSGAAVTGVSGSGSVYTVSVSTGSGMGDIHLTIPASATITDGVGNVLNSAFTNGDTYEIGMSVYLPLVVNNFVSAPDLVVDSLSASGSQVTVTISNQGNAPVVDAFWVDVYLNPTTAPTGVNQPWPDLGSQGLVWGVEGAALPLDPGESLTLTIGDSYYWSDLSSFNTPLPVGSNVYAQVDSADAQTTYGGVLESHEVSGGTYNNITGPVVSLARGAGLALPATGSFTPAVSSSLPPRD